MGWSAAALSVTVAVAMVLEPGVVRAAESKATELEAPPVAPATARAASGQSIAAQADAALAKGHLAAAAVGYLDAAKQTGEAVYYGKAAEAMSLGSLTPLMSTKCYIDSEGSCTHPDWEIGATILSLCGALVVVGIPLAIIGGQKVPVGSDASSHPLRIGLGVGNAALQWRY